MKAKEWFLAIVTFIVSVAGTLFASGVMWGSTKNQVDNHEARIMSIENWKDDATNKLGNIDGKLDVLLQVNGASYTPKRK